MLKWAIWLLVLGNAGYFAWSQGYLDTLGLKPVEQREPQRMAQQVRPETLRLLNGPRPETAPVVSAPAPEAPAAVVVEPPLPAPSVSEPVAPAPAPPPSSTVAVAAGSGPRACWQAGGFTNDQAELLRAELALLGLPASGFSFTEVRSGGRWIVYMGRYDNQQQVDRKKDELRALGVSFREINAPGLAPGLALGTYSSEAAAQQALQKAERDGIRTAKVAQERAESQSVTVRLPAITDTQRAAIDGLGEAMAGKRLQRCG
ncbi:SPOR domain-containing protein [Hydrogenophaga sp.]|jgi:cell division protein FtsN|uniref:SPOR domain-containing protein n=1 Tax=Hydrogenophaga sp. TaxID=1904254 RepID=UPI0025C63817|nr:SPOR domain-containing protein [Hydrogenophaga sp.]MDO9133170.1 SPOR domain-containing protein [Hydrogenophaga sp.]MDP1783477.1 SPOR domain-containing protein [Hydrogenophaga sp.]MDP2252406.1 SPOR domain-containing protein [Hydrogenophaga sp.]